MLIFCRVVVLMNRPDSCWILLKSNPTEKKTKNRGKIGQPWRVYPLAELAAAHLCPITFWSSACPLCYAFSKLGQKWFLVGLEKGRQSFVFPSREGHLHAFAVVKLSVRWLSGIIYSRFDARTQD